MMKTVYGTRIRIRKAISGTVDYIAFKYIRIIPGIVGIIMICMMYN